MTASSECRIDIQAIRLDNQCREDLGAQHRNVLSHVRFGRERPSAGPDS